MEGKEGEKKDVVEDEKEESKNTKEEEKLIKSDTNKDKEDTKDDEKVSTTKTEDIDAARPSEYCTKLCKKQRENDKYKPVLVHGNDFREAIQKWTKNHDDSPYGPILGCWDTSQVTDMSSAFMDSDDDDSAMNLNCWETKEVKYMQGMFFNSKFNRPLDSWNTHQVENMAFMFAASVFNQNISSWDVVNVKDTESMFEFSKFNEQLNGWHTDKEIKPVKKKKKLFNAAGGRRGRDVDIDLSEV